MEFSGSVPNLVPLLATLYETFNWFQYKSVNNCLRFIGLITAATYISSVSDKLIFTLTFFPYKPLIRFSCFGHMVRDKVPGQQTAVEYPECLVTFSQQLPRSRERRRHTNLVVRGCQRQHDTPLPLNA